MEKGKLTRHCLLSYGTFLLLKKSLKIVEACRGLGKENTGQANGFYEILRHIVCLYGFSLSCTSSPASQKLILQRIHCMLFNRAQEVVFQVVFLELFRAKTNVTRKNEQKICKNKHNFQTTPSVCTVQCVLYIYWLNFGSMNVCIHGHCCIHFSSPGECSLNFRIA